MNQRIIIIILFILLLTCYMLYSEEDTTRYSITVIIENLRNSKGHVGAILFDSEDGFPRDDEKAFDTALGEIKDNKCSFSFKKVPPGRYAIMVLHDENKSGDMDTSFLGLPKEGYGASNNAKASFGPPKFEAACFTVDSSDVTVKINIVY